MQTLYWGIPAEYSSRVGPRILPRDQRGWDERSDQGDDGQSHHAGHAQGRDHYVTPAHTRGAKTGEAEALAGDRCAARPHAAGNGRGAPDPFRSRSPGPAARPAVSRTGLSTAGITSVTRPLLERRCAPLWKIVKAAPCCTAAFSPPPGKPQPATPSSDGHRISGKETCRM